MRKDGMLLFINVSLGLCLGAGAATLIAEIKSSTNRDIANDSTMILLFLFFIYFANLLRTFLGFVKFYQDDSLYDSGYDEANISRDKLCLLRLIDFIAMMLIVLALLFQGMTLNLYVIFSWLFIFSSVLFIVRNIVLYYAFKILKNRIANVKNEADKIEVDGRFSVVKTWIRLDIAFIIPSILLLIGASSENSQQFIFGFSAAILLIISGYDIWEGKRYYFGGAYDAGI